MFDLVVTIVVLLGIALLVWLFERRRAEEIERDLSDQARRRSGRDRED